MCTLTAYRGDSEIMITMNRDEANTRGPERPPEIRRATAGPEWIAPTDSDKGGTWMAANDHGLVACLLNAYREGESLLPDPSRAHRSRGEIIPTLMEMRSFDEAIRWIEGDFEPNAYPSFMLFLFAPGDDCRVTWFTNGELVVEPIDGTWHIESSAGWDTEEIARWRTERLRQWIEDGSEKVGTLPTYHLLQVPGEEDKSPLMRRDWSATRSITQVIVDRNTREVEMRYWGAPSPDSGAPDDFHGLTLVEESK